jgi:hypothetical protein
MPEDAIAAYDRAWNTPDATERIELLRQSLTPDAELVDPSAGRIRGYEAISARIGGFGERYPGAQVTITSTIDEHNGCARYAWSITDPDHNPLLHGIDIVDRAEDQRLNRVVMFFGDLPPAG